MIGSAQGIMISTDELEIDQTVSVDHQLFQVYSVQFLSNGTAKVTLIPQVGDNWVLEVAREDWEEPMWELV